MMQKSGKFSTTILNCPSNTTSIQKAAELVKNQNQSAIFVMDNEDVLGIVSSRDINNRMAAQQIEGKERITKVMSAPVYSISEKASIQEAVRIFKKTGFFAPFN
ncbi:MAG TPA: CBS domain-containing protein [Bacteroidetes bacterium]|nr:CBS domain-containing protein [Bacteroidota bacterium]